jgi:tryptophanyl-tRNA synthetase
MSASLENTAIFTKDTPKEVKRKVNNAFTGGQPSAKLQRELGGDPSVCSVFKYHFMLFTLDDEEIKKIESRCRSGSLLCGECKNNLTQKINAFLKTHQEEREKAKDRIDEFLIKEKLDLKEIFLEKLKKL